MTERITIAPTCSTSGEEILTGRRESLKRFSSWQTRAFLTRNPTQWRVTVS